MKLPSVLLLPFLLVATGCSGVKFAPGKVNHPLPETFTKRAIYPNDVAGYEFQDLVGNILYIEPKKDPIPIEVIRPDDYQNKVIPINIKDANNYYRSRIQSGAQAQGSYLAFAANFNAEDMAELTLVDVARAGIVFKDPLTWTNIKLELLQWVQNHPLTDTNAKRLWVKAVLLTSRVYTGYTKIEADASGQVGEVTGVKTGVYRKSENDVRSVIIGFEAFDVDRFAEKVKKDTGAPPFVSVEAPDFDDQFVNDYLDDARNTDTINGVIKLK